ncbi:endolytic transglycosylase MltG, partial [Patescibacteria group bacterium]|nr:endolytic transglycosylase MltG [Patescibacteria group bacterium]
LPPTPICNPGESAIRSAIYPKNSDFWFYLSDKQGKTIFSKTSEEHNQNVEKYLK